MSVRGVAAVISLLLCATPAMAEPKTLVSVQFELAHASYQRLFTPERLASLPQDAAKRLALDLRREVPFLSFAAGGASSFRLKVAIRPRGRTGGIISPEAGLDFTLELPGVQATTEQFVFRQSGDSSPIDAEHFVDEIAGALTESDYRGRLRTLLQRVPIAQSATVSSDPEGWRLPVAADELCIDSGRLAVSNKTTRGALVQTLRFPAEYAELLDGSGFCTPEDAEKFRQVVLGANVAEVTGVWLVEGSDCALGGR